MIDFKKMMAQAQQVQSKLAQMQEKFKDLLVEGESGGGMVKVTMSCSGVVKAIDIDPSLISIEDKETLEDLVIAAVNNAGEAKDRRVQEEGQKLMQESGIDPNMAGGALPF
jgi:hypothetical protein